MGEGWAEFRTVYAVLDDPTLSEIEGESAAGRDWKERVQKIFFQSILFLIGFSPQFQTYVTLASLKKPLTSLSVL